MSEAVTPSGDPNCQHCAGAGYRVGPRGGRALATLCDCLPECERCGGTGERYVQQGRGMRVGRCICQMLPDRVQLFNRSGIPARHASSSFRSFQPNKNPGSRTAYQFCAAWADSYRPKEENPGLVLMGEVGRGKTHLLVAMLHMLIMEKGVPCRFVEFSHLISEIKAGFDEGVGESRSVMPLADVPVLAIDELGKGRGTEFERVILDQLISRRYNALATILATTNYAFKGPTGLVESNLARPDRVQSLGDRVGERNFSRLIEMCRGMPVGGEDYRRLASM